MKKQKLENKSYKLMGGKTPLAFMLASRHHRRNTLMYFDEEQGVSKENQVLQKFLSIHPGNGNIFEEIDHKRDAAQDLENVETELDAQILARELDTNKLISVCRVFLGASVDKMSIPELKRDVLLFAKHQPYEFMEVLDDPMLELTNVVAQFFEEGLLSFRNGNKDVYFDLKKNKSKLLTVPFGEEAYYIVASYMQSDEGLETYKLLKKSLNNKQ